MTALTYDRTDARCVNPRTAMTTIEAMNDQQQKHDKAREIVAQLIRAEISEAHATDALIESGSASLEALALALSSENETAHRVATIVLSRIETRRALAPILNGVLKLSHKPDLIATLLHSAARLLSPKDTERVRPVLLRFLQHPDPSIRAAALECVRSTEDEKALALVAQARLERANTQPSSQTQSTVPRAASMVLIEQLGSDAESTRRQAQAELLHHPDRDQVIVEHLHHASEHIRRSVLEVAAIVVKPDWNQALIDIAGSENRPTIERVLALRGVHHLSQLPQDQHLITVLLRHSAEPLRAEAARLATTSPHVALRHGALNLLSRDGSWVRKRIAEGWATFADTSRQPDLPYLIDILRAAPWLRDPSPVDIETYQTLCGGIVRMVELGCFIDSTLLHEFAALQKTSAPAIAEITRQAALNLSQSTGIQLELDATKLSGDMLSNPDPTARLAFLTTLADQPPAALLDLLPQLIRFLYRANQDEILALIDVLYRIKDQRSLDALTRISQLPEETVRAKAHQALQTYAVD